MCSTERNTGNFHQILITCGQKLALALTVGLLAWPAIAQEPTPETFVDWPVPNLTEWNNLNTRTVVNTSTAEPAVSTRHTQFRALEGEIATDITYIYPDQATRDADADGLGIGSVAFLSWALDDGSGRPPGIQVVTDDFAFPTNNCVMASGEREDPELGIVPKTCSDPQGSSKRYFLEVTEADVPIDLVFDTDVKDIRYKGVKDPAEDGGAALEAFRQEFGIGRIYRVLGKFLNLTDKRIVSMEVQLGTGVGEEFTPLLFEEDGVGFELRPLVDREFFEGETGAPDISVWNPMRFAFMAPKLFDDGERVRFDPGFFDDASAGLIPPQLTEPADQSQFIDSGTVLQDGIIGAMTPNHFDLQNNQAFGAVPPLVGNVFGYQLPDSKAPFVIARHDDGNAESESDALVAWWDGFDYRYGQAGDPDLGVGPFGIVPGSQLQQWAALPIGLDPELTPDPARYEFLLSDDLANFNMDVYIHISENILDEVTGEPEFDNITLRLVANSVEGVGVTGAPGTEDPEWVKAGNEAPPLSEFMPITGVPVAINDLAVTEEDQLVSINVLANDLLDGALVDPSVATVEIVDSPDNGTAVADEVAAGKPIEYTPAPGFTGDDTFTYTVEVMGEVSNPATVKVTVNPSPIPDAPVAANDSAVTFEFTPVTIDVLANDTLSDAPIPAGATLEVIDQPVNGIASATVLGDSIVYDPKGTPPETTDVFTYRVTVEGVDSNLALVIVRVDEDIDLIFADGFE
ncbi:MAG: choice-of-anchor F family protein [Pseudomonadota bacterium]